MRKEFTIYTVLSLMILGLFAFENEHTNMNSGNAMHVEEGLDIKSIESNLSATIFLINHQEPGIKIEGPENVLKSLALVINDGHLSISQQKASYNPISLLKQAVLQEESLKIYIHKSNAKDVYVRNEAHFNEVSKFENEETGMITLKNPKLFHTTKQDPGACLTNSKVSCSKEINLL